MKQSIKLFALFVLFIISSTLSACGGANEDSTSDIKDNFCGIHIDYRYCKCAFHEEFCGSVGLSPSEARDFVWDEYDKWKDPQDEDDEYGVIEKNGKLYLNSKPGEVLRITSDDLPVWAWGVPATVGALIIDVGAPDTITHGDRNVILNGLPVARVGDNTAHGGVIVTGSDKIFVNGVPAAIIGGRTTCPMINPGPVPHVGGLIAHNPS